MQVQIQFFQQLHQQVVVEAQIQHLVLNLQQKMEDLVEVRKEDFQDLVEQETHLQFHLHKEIMVETQAELKQVQILFLAVVEVELVLQVLQIQVLLKQEQEELVFQLQYQDHL